MPETPESNLNETIERTVGILVRRRWWVLGTAPIVAVLTLGVLSVLPNRYTSEATLLVVQQQVPQRYVVPTATTDMTDALQATTQEVLSRTRLLGIIDQFGLFPKERRSVPPETLVELMRQKIEIKPVESRADKRELTAFNISFTADQPSIAQEVTGRLTSLFIEENLTTRERQSKVTTTFLGEQLEAAKKKLADQEERVRNFKLENLGELPEQQQGNVAILTGLQSQLQNTMAGISRAQQQQVYLQSLLGGYKSLTSRGGPARYYVPGSTSRPLKVSPIEEEEGTLMQLESRRRTLLAQYTPQHPEVIAVNQQIARAEALLEQLRAAKAPPATDAPTAAASKSTPPVQEDEGDVQMRGQVEQVKSQLEANKLELTNLLKDEKQLKENIAQYQNRLNATPVREQQLAGILRDYDLLKLDYTDLLGKQLQSQLAANLEKRQEGQQFRLVDRPSLPTVPSSPKRLQISLGGFAAGLVLGLALALLAEVRDSSFHSEQELKKQFQFPLIVGIPLLLTAEEQASRKWTRALEWAGGSVLMLLLLSIEIYGVLKFRHG